MAPRAHQVVYSGHIYCGWVVEDSCRGFWFPFSFETEAQANLFGGFALWVYEVDVWNWTLPQMIALRERFMNMRYNEMRLYAVVRMLGLLKRVRERLYAPGGAMYFKAKTEFEQAVKKQRSA